MHSTVYSEIPALSHTQIIVSTDWKSVAAPRVRGRPFPLVPALLQLLGSAAALGTPRGGGTMLKFSQIKSLFLKRRGDNFVSNTGVVDETRREDRKFPMFVVPIARAIEVTGRDAELPCHEDLRDAGYLVEYARQRCSAASFSPTRGSATSTLTALMESSAADTRGALWDHGGLRGFFSVLVCGRRWRHMKEVSRKQERHVQRRLRAQSLTLRDPAVATPLLKAWPSGKHPLLRVDDCRVRGA